MIRLKTLNASPGLEPITVPRVAIVCSHPIQYLSPWFRYLARDTRLQITVLYGDDHGVRAGFDPDFEKDIAWNVDLLSGYPSLLLKNQALRPGVGHFFGILPGAGDLLHHLEQRSFDAVVIQGWNYALYPLALFFAKTARLPVIMRCESVRLSDAKSSLQNRSPKELLKHSLLKRYLSQCAAALAVSTANRRLLLHYGVPAQRIFSSPYAVDGDRFALPEKEREAARQSFRQRLGLDEKTPLLLFVGKLIAVKAPELLLQAFLSLRELGVAAHLLICGDGPLRDRLQEKVRGRSDVSFSGFVNQAELPALYAAADALVLPSVRETFGVVVAEAMHAGLPVVVSSGVGCAEDLVPTSGSLASGLQFAVGDEHMLFDRLRTLCEGEAAEARRKALSQGARARISTWTYTEATSGLIDAVTTVLQDGIR